MLHATTPITGAGVSRGFTADDCAKSFAGLYARGDCKHKITVTRRDTVIDTALPALDSDTIEAARARAPGYDIYALQAEWFTWWQQSGQPPLRSPSKAFLG